MTLAAFLTFTTLVILGAISPGPAVLMAARTGLSEGFRTGVMLAIGIGFGALFWAGSAMFGLAILFSTAPMLLWAFKILGGAYLLWMGWHLWKNADQPFVTADDRPVPRSAWSGFRLGLMTQLSNPKPAVVFSAIFLGTVPPETPFWQLGALLVIVLVAEIVWNIGVARIFSLDRTRATYVSLKRVIDRCFGGLLALLGAKVALS